MRASLATLVILLFVGAVVGCGGGGDGAAPGFASGGGGGGGGDGSDPGFDGGMDPGMEGDVDGDPGMEGDIDAGPDGPDDDIAEDIPMDDLGGPDDPLGPDDPDGIDPIGPDGPDGIDPIGPDGPDGIDPIGPDDPDAIDPIGPDDPGAIDPIGPDDPGAIDPIGPDDPGAIDPIGPDDPAGGAPQPKPPAKPKPPARKLSYKDQAIEAFREGDEKKGLDYVYAHALFDPAAGKQVKLGWLQPFKRPGLAERWTVGITYVPDKRVGYNGPPAEFGKKPPQVIQQQQQGNGGGRFPRGRGRPQQNQPKVNAEAVKREMPTSHAGIVSYFAGSFGDKVLARLKSAASGGGFGDVMRAAPSPSPKQLVQDDHGRGGFGGGPPDGGVDPVDPVDPIGPPDDPGGGPGELQPIEPEPIEPDDPGLAPVDDLGPGGGGGNERERPRMPMFTGAVGISPGVSYIGMGTRSTLVERTREDGADVLLAIEVTSILTGNGILNTSIVMELIDPKTGASLRKSREVNNLSYFYAKEKPGAKDPVDESIDDFFRYVVDNLYLKEMPALTAENVAGRIGALTSQSQSEPLRLMVELLYYRNQGLATDDQLAAAYGAFLGDEAQGRKLVGGTPEEKKAVLDGLLHKPVNKGLDPGAVDFFGGGDSTE